MIISSIILLIMLFIYFQLIHTMYIIHISCNFINITIHLVLLLLFTKWNITIINEMMIIISSIVLLSMLFIYFQLIHTMYIIHISWNFIYITIYLVWLQSSMMITEKNIHNNNYYSWNDDDIIHNTFDNVIYLLSIDTYNIYHSYFMKF